MCWVFAPTADKPAFAHQGKVMPVPSMPFPAVGISPGFGMARHVKRQVLDFSPTSFTSRWPDLLGQAALDLAQKHGIPSRGVHHNAL